MVRNTRYHRTMEWMVTAAALGLVTSFMTCSAQAAELSTQLQSAANKGLEIFMHPSFGGNGKACNSCHRNGGVGPGALPDGTRLPSLSNAAAIFPRFNRKGKLVTLEDQVRNCVAGAIEGTPPAYDSDKMRFLVVYLTSLAQGKTIDMGGKPR
jgi:thiosulfate dehydrogenase